MVSIRFLVTCLALVLLMGGKSGAQQGTVGGKVPPPAAAAAPGPATTPNYVLAANDLLEIKVFQEPDLDTTARIAGDGKLVFPLIGEVALAGKTVPQGARLIRDRLEARFLVDPQVTVRVVEPTKRLFTILGQVQHPGTFRFPDREVFNLIQVIGVAGGYTRLANPSRVTVKRSVDGKETVFKIDAKQMARDTATKAFEVLPGDMITVGERLF